jgi:hypothetical protein
MQQSNSILMEQIMSQNFDFLSNNTDDTIIYTKSKKYFDSCLNIGQINDRGIQPILPFAQQIIDDAMGNNLDFIDMLVKLNLKGVFPIIRYRYGKVEGHDPAGTYCNHSMLI